MSGEPHYEFQAGIVCLLDPSKDITRLENIIPQDRPFLRDLTKMGFHYNIEIISGSRWARVYTDRPTGREMR